MIGFFPPLYPGELFYSACARFQQSLGFPSARKILHELFGSGNALAVIDLPGRIEKFTSSLPPNSELSPREIIWKHTLFPFYAAFRGTALSCRLQQSLLTETGRWIHLRLGIMAGRVRPPEYFRYCPECHRESLKRYGECYWHRAHQIAGVETCPIHLLWLESSSVRRRNRSHRHPFLPSLSEDCSLPGRPIRSGDAIGETCIRLASAAYWLLKQENLHRDATAFRAQYVERLQQLDLATESGRIRQREIRSRMLALYDSALLQRLQCPLKATHEDDWLSRLLRSPRTAPSPIRHLVFMDFLKETPESLFQDKCQPTPSPRFLRKRRIERENLRKATLIKLWADRSYSLRKIGRQLSVDPLTVKRHAATLGLPFPRWGKRKTTGDPKQLRLGLRTRPSKSVSHQRRLWIQVLSQFRSKGITACRHSHPALYAWLYRHDRNWLKLHRGNRKLARPTPSVDWAKRDAQLLDDLRLLPRESTAIRRTVAQLAIALDARAWVQKHPDKLPRTIRALLCLSESREAFAIRRIQMVHQRLGIALGTLPRWRFIRLAGLRPDLVQNRRIREEMAQILQKAS